MLELCDVLAARERISPFVVHTPLLRASALDPILGCQVFLKHEGFQPIGAFKLRGAVNKVLSLTPQQQEKGIVCASSGNHAQGVAWAARQTGCRATIVMPTDVNPMKLAGVQALGGETILEGTLSSQRQKLVTRLAQEQGMVDVPPYADPFVSAGQGTIGLEILEDLPDVTVVVAPIGGGGLISGIATSIKGKNPAVTVVGAEPSVCPRYGLSRRAGKPMKAESSDTIADGTRTDMAHPDIFPVIESRVDTLVTARDESIEAAMYLLMTTAKVVAEPSAALPLAAVLEGNLTLKPEDKVVFVLSAGNADPALLCRILETGAKGGYDALIG